MSSSQPHRQISSQKQHVLKMNKAIGHQRRQAPQHRPDAATGNLTDPCKAQSPYAAGKILYEHQQLQYGQPNPPDQITAGPFPALEGQDVGAAKIRGQDSLYHHHEQLEHPTNDNQLIAEPSRQRWQYGNIQSIKNQPGYSNQPPVLPAPTTIINNNNITFYAAAPSQVNQQLPFFSGANQDAFFEILKSNQIPQLLHSNSKVKNRQIHAILEQRQPNQQSSGNSMKIAPFKELNEEYEERNSEQQQYEMKREPIMNVQPGELAKMNDRSQQVNHQVGEKLNQRKERQATQNQNSVDSFPNDQVTVDVGRGSRQRERNLGMQNESCLRIHQEPGKQPALGLRYQPQVAQGFLRHSKQPRSNQQSREFKTEAGGDGLRAADSKHRNMELNHLVERDQTNRSNCAKSIDIYRESNEEVAASSVSLVAQRSASKKNQSSLKEFRALKLGAGQVSHRGQFDSQSMRALPVAYAPYMETSSITRDQKEHEGNFESHSCNRATLGLHDVSYISKSGTKPSRSSLQLPVTATSEANKAPRGQGRQFSNLKPNIQIHRQPPTMPSLDAGGSRIALQKNKILGKSPKPSSQLSNDYHAVKDEHIATTEQVEEGAQMKKRRQINIQQYIGKHFTKSNCQRGENPPTSQKKRTKVQSQTYEIEQPSSIPKQSKYLGSVIASISCSSGWSPEKASQLQHHAAEMPNARWDGIRFSRQDCLRVNGHSKSISNMIVKDDRQMGMGERQDEIYGIGQKKEKPKLLNQPIQSMQRRGSQQANEDLNKEEMQYGIYQSAQELYLPQVTGRSVSQSSKRDEDQYVQSLNSSPARPQARRLVPIKQEEFERLSVHSVVGSQSRYHPPRRQNQSESKEANSGFTPTQEYSGQAISVEITNWARRSPTKNNQVAIHRHKSSYEGLHHNQNEKLNPARPASDQKHPQFPADEHLDGQLQGSSSRNDLDDFDGIEQQILNMEYEPTGSGQASQNHIAEIVADLREEEWPHHKAYSGHCDGAVAATDLKEELEKTQRLALMKAIQQSD